jgi:RNA polymerase sigma-70 factor (sigma-E family)
VRAERVSGGTERDAQFHAFVAERRSRLVQTATLLTAGDRHLAEDLVQATLTKLYVAWPAFRRADNPNAYVHRVLVNALIDERRRIWRRREESMADVPERAGDAFDGRIGDPVRQALRGLPPRMRAVLVLRYFLDLGVAESAEILGCTEGTVKSQTVKALNRLRTVLEPGSAVVRDPHFFPQGATS